MLIMSTFEQQTFMTNKKT